MIPQLVQTILDKSPLPAGRKRLGPVIRFNHIEWQNRQTCSGRGQQRLMIRQPQIPLEPHQMHGALFFGDHHSHSKAILSLIPSVEIIYSAAKSPAFALLILFDPRKRNRNTKVLQHADGLSRRFYDFSNLGDTNTSIDAKRHYQSKSASQQVQITLKDYFSWPSACFCFQL